MHQRRCRDYGSAEDLAYALMAETYAENGYLASELGDDRCADAGVVRTAGTRRYDDCIYSESTNCRQLCCVVSKDNGICPEFAELLDQVVDK